MAEPHAASAAYLYANGTLRNRPGIKDQRKLSAFERAISRFRQTEIDRGLVDIPRTYDADHLSKIHRHLFNDVYAWAGQQRTVDIVKRSDGRPFAQVERSPVNHIDRCLAEASDRIRRAPWAQANQAMFGHYMAETFAWLNYAHPFREGNGRATRLFLRVSPEAAVVADARELHRMNFPTPLSPGQANAPRAASAQPRAQSRAAVADVAPVAER